MVLYMVIDSIKREIEKNQHGQTNYSLPVACRCEVK